MRFFGLTLSFATLAGSALAQTTLTLPRAGANLTAGREFVAQVAIDESVPKTDIIAIAIGLSQCPADARCFTATERMGTILYQGSFVPSSSQNPNFFANYTLEVPPDFPTGGATLNVANFYVYGDYSTPSWQFAGTGVMIVAA